MRLRQKAIANETIIIMFIPDLVKNKFNIHALYNAHVVIFLIILLLIDLYAFQAFRFVTRGYSQYCNSLDKNSLLVCFMLLFFVNRSYAIY